MSQGIPITIIPLNVEHSGLCHDCPITHDTIIAAGPLVKQDKMTLPGRPVLRRMSDATYVIHTQYFDGREWEQGRALHDSFDAGAYPQNDFADACKAFAERCTKWAYHCGRLTADAQVETV